MINQLKAFTSKSLSRRKRKKKISASRQKKLSMESLEQRIALTVQQFQDNGTTYTGTEDAVIYSQLPSVTLGTETTISVDQQDVGGVRQGLLKFGGIFGSGPNQIPLGSTINSATLTLNVNNDSNSAMVMSFYRMISDWSETTATWNTFGSIGGVQASEGEAFGLPPDSIHYDSTTGVKTIDVAASLRHWASGENNFGWLIESATTNGWDFNTSDGAQADRPKLTVDYTAPAGAGTFEFLSLTPETEEGHSGSKVVNVPVARLGGSDGTVMVDYSIASGSTNGATAGVDFVGATGQLSFGPGETVKNIPVTIHGDTDLEGFETIAITLSNATGGSAIKPSAGAATLSIGDDDALINEVLANISSSTVDETNREYIELIGTPGASLNGYQFVVFESEEEEGSGGVGVVDFVVDLSGQTFGSNGLLVITPTNWAYTKDAATNRMITTELDGAGGKLEDSSQTFALIRGGSLLVKGTDYDTIGAYLTSAGTAVENIPGEIGKLDALPAGAQLVDSVAVNEGGSGDRDRAVNVTGAPGVHVHQPDGINSTNTTSDAVSRRVGQTTPNTIGVWFNGDITNATTGVYRTDSNNPTAASVTSPAGALITPGAPNILRNVGLEVKSITVDEVLGTVSIDVLRTGDLNGSITVGYTTADGTAKAGQDFTAPTPGSVLTFGDQDNEETITIPLTVDTVAEGFESFTILLTSATSPFQIIAASAIVTIVDANVLTKSFQEGVNGYTGVRDTTLNSRLPSQALGDPGIAANITVDEQLGNFTGRDARPAQGLIAFDNLFGNAVDQVPPGAHIYGGFITLDVVNPSASNAEVRFFRMLQDWNESDATWFFPQNGVSGIADGITPDDVEATAEPDAIVTTPGIGNPGISTTVDIALDIDTLQAWSNGVFDNYGWSIISDSAIGWNFASADYFGAVARQKPKLTILYTEAAPSDAGSFRFSDSEYKVNEDGSVTVTVERVGGTSGAATLNWALAAGTGALSDVSSATSDSVSFSGSEIKKTFTITPNNDTALEANETLALSLTGTGVTIDRNSATLTIRDNDFNTASPSVLLNEFFINSPGSDGRHEFAELAGLAGSGMGSLYFVIIDGDAGQAEGVSDVVIDLGPYLNGANGISLIGAANNFDFDLPGAATFIASSILNVEAVANDTATYSLIYSPNSNLATGNFDYDWNNDGTLDLPAGAVFVDSVTVTDGGGTDRAYGPGSNILNVFNNPPVVADAASRQRGNTTANSGAAWFYGDLELFGDDPLRYNTANSQGLPVTGAALSPGEMNTGSAVQSPLVSLTAITPNVDGTVTLAFNGPVSQVLTGNGGFGVNGGQGIAITNQSGAVIPGVDVVPIVSGLFSNTLTLSFTGSSVVGGQLPTGSYRLNFSGASLIGNGRVIDAANTATAAGSNHTFNFSKTITNPIGDYSGNGTVDAADYTVWRDSLGTGFVLPNRDPANLGNVSQDDFNSWVSHFGQTGSVGFTFPGAGSGGGGLALAAAASEEPVQQPLAAAVEPTLDFVDLAFADLASNNSATTTLSAKAAGADAAASRRFAAGGSAPFDHSLLLAARRFQRATGPELEEARCAAHGDGEFGDLDTVFAKLGEKFSARKGLRRAV